MWTFNKITTLYLLQFSRSVVSNSLDQHARPLCPSPTPGVHSDSCPSSQWCHPAISSSVIPFFSCPQSLPASESFPMSQLFAWRGGQGTGVSALASFLPKKSQGWSPSEYSINVERQYATLEESPYNCSPLSLLIHYASYASCYRLYIVRFSIRAKYIHV